MSGDRLTRTELTWLLAQEARTAAQKLRSGIGGAPETVPPPSFEEGTGGVESTLNRLDEAVSMLASLHGHAIPRGRRGKIDLGALIWEIAPEARVQMEMGEGTTVFGDESELRRMLQVLISQGGDPTSARGASEVSLRRQGDEVVVGVTLGPDKPATFEAERAWLSRMAVRYGGSLHLEGATYQLRLLADVDSSRREVESLKKELAAAQAQGEAYARELAAVVARSDGMPHSTRSSMPGGSQRPPSGDGLALLVAGARSVGAELRGILSAIGRDMAPLRDREGESGEIAKSVARHITAASEIVGDLARLGACPVGELPRHADVADLLRDVVRDDTVRAARHDVRVVVDTPDSAFEVVPVGTLTVLVHTLVDHAITASPPGSEVRIALSDAADGLSLTVDDAGPPFPPGAGSGVLSRDFEVLVQGRSAGLPLVAATAIAAQLGLSLDIEDAPHGGARLRLTIPRP